MIPKIRNLSAVIFLAATTLAIGQFGWAMPAQSKENYAIFEAVYDAKIKIAGGQVRMATSLTDGGDYTYQYTVIPGKLIRLFTKGELKEITKFEVVDGRPRTVDYTLINTIGSKPRNGHVIFDWDNDTVKGNYKEHTIDIPMPKNAVDRGMFQLVLMADLRNDNLQEQYAVYDKDEFIPISVEIVGEEEIKVPFGTFSTVILRHANGDASDETLMWCAKELGYLPIRFQVNSDGSKVLRANLKTIIGTPPE